MSNTHSQLHRFIILEAQSNIIVASARTLEAAGRYASARAKRARRHFWISDTESIGKPGYGDDAKVWDSKCGWAKLDDHSF
jgi:hypothetical protein